MSGKPCRVSFVDLRGIEHSTEVQASSLFEAATLGLEALRAAAFTDPIGPATRLTVEVKSPCVQHVVTVQQLKKWAETESGSPAETVQKKRAARAIGT